MKATSDLMRGAGTFIESPFTLHRLEEHVPTNHVLLKMDGLFAGVYQADVKGGRPGIASEELLRAMLPQVFYSVRSERQSWSRCGLTTRAST